MTCEYMAQQEGVLCEEVLLLSETNEDVCVKVKVHARVMGKLLLHVQLTVDNLNYYFFFYYWGTENVSCCNVTQKLFFPCVLLPSSGSLRLLCTF